MSCPDQLVKEKVRTEAEDVIRKMVDAVMVAELDRIRAVDQEKPPKPSKKGKKDKKDKGKRRKKDPLDGRNVEELFSELVLAGVVTRPQRVRDGEG